MKRHILNLLDHVSDRAARRVGLGRTGDSYDVIDMAFWRAGVEAAEFYEQHLMHARVFTETVDMIVDGVRLADPNGLFLEFGVATGKTIRAIASSHPGPVYGFDSFEGLPEDWYEGYPKGHFARTQLPEVPANVTLVKGWFDQTLPDFLAEHPGPLSYVNVDCDLYSSASFVLQALTPRIVPGTVIQFDEFFNYPGWRNHEYKAFQELVEAQNLKFRYHSFLRRHQAVCVVVE